MNTLDDDKRNYNQCPLKYFNEEAKMNLYGLVIMASGVNQDGRAGFGFTLDRERVHTALITKYMCLLNDAAMARFMAVEGEPTVENSVSQYDVFINDNCVLTIGLNTGAIEYDSQGTVAYNMFDKLAETAAFDNDIPDICNMFRFWEGQLPKCNLVHIKKIKLKNGDGELITDKVSVIGNVQTGGSYKEYQLGDNGECDILLSVKTEEFWFDTMISTYEGELLIDDNPIYIEIEIDRLFTLNPNK